MKTQSAIRNPQSAIILQALPQFTGEIPDRLRLNAVPIGEWQIVDATGKRIVLRHTPEMIAEMKRNFDAKIYTADPQMNAGAHFADSGAYGWPEIMEVEPDGLYVTFTLTPKGKAVLAGREYRYYSPGYWNEWRDTQGALHRNVFFELTLTNVPGLPGMELSRGTFLTIPNGMIFSGQAIEIATTKPQEGDTEMTPEERAALIEEMRTTLTGIVQPLEARLTAIEASSTTLKAEVAGVGELVTAKRASDEQAALTTLTATVADQLKGWRFGDGGTQIIAPQVAESYAGLIAKLPEAERESQLTMLKANPPALVTLGPGAGFTAQDTSGKLTPEHLAIAKQMGNTPEMLEKHLAA